MVAADVVSEVRKRITDCSNLLLNLKSFEIESFSFTQILVELNTYNLIFRFRRPVPRKNNPYSITFFLCRCVSVHLCVCLFCWLCKVPS